MSAEPIPQRSRWHATNLDRSPSEGVGGEIWQPPKTEYLFPDAERPANVVSSLCSDGKPALDIDIPCELVPSSTPGHHHLYFPEIALEWDKYETLLQALADAGIIQQGCMRSSIERRSTMLRLPGVKKGDQS